MAKYYSQAQRRAAKKYHEENLYRFTVSIPKERRKAVEAFCMGYKCEDGKGVDGHGAPTLTINKTVNTLLREAMGLTEAEWKAK